MRVRHNKDAINILRNNKDLFIDDCEKQHGKWRWFFSNNKPLHLEIGCGKGQFIIANALKYPNINFIALEKDSTILTKAIKKAEQIISQGYKIKNLKFINGDANKIEFIFDDNEIDEIYLNFSDPWPKKRQAKRRLTNTFFLKQYYKILKPHKNIVLKTDNEGFFDYSIQEFELNKNLFEINYKTNNLYGDLKNIKNTNNIVTEYEERFVQKGELISKLIAESKKEY